MTTNENMGVALGGHTLAFIRVHLRLALLVIITVLIQVIPRAQAGATKVDPLYAQHCSQCHGADRLGGTGPALLPQNLERLKPAGAVMTISAGRAATQMPGFADKLSPEQIQSLADYIYLPPAQVPHWGMTEINASRVIHFKPGVLSDTPVFKADPLNLFLVV